MSEYFEKLFTHNPQKKNLELKGFSPATVRHVLKIIQDPGNKALYVSENIVETIHFLSYIQHLGIMQNYGWLLNRLIDESNALQILVSIMTFMPGSNSILFNKAISIIAQQFEKFIRRLSTCNLNSKNLIKSLLLSKYLILNDTFGHILQDKPRELKLYKIMSEFCEASDDLHIEEFLPYFRLDLIRDYLNIPGK